MNRIGPYAKLTAEVSYIQSWKIDRNDMRAIDTPKSAASRLALFLAVTYFLEKHTYLKENNNEKPANMNCRDQDNQIAQNPCIGKPSTIARGGPTRCLNSACVRTSHGVVTWDAPRSTPPKYPFLPLQNTPALLPWGRGLVRRMRTGRTRWVLLSPFDWVR